MMSFDKENVLHSARQEKNKYEILSVKSVSIVWHWIHIWSLINFKSIKGKKKQEKKPVISGNNGSMSRPIFKSFELYYYFFLLRGGSTP